MNKEQKRERNAEIQRRFQRKLRYDSIMHYGGKCVCCGEDQMEFLSIDHIKGKGTKHRKMNNLQIGYWLKKHNYPKGFRVLCHNCNMALGFYGFCPHGTKGNFDRKN